VRRKERPVLVPSGRRLRLDDVAQSGDGDRRALGPRYPSSRTIGPSVRRQLCAASMASKAGRASSPIPGSSQPRRAFRAARGSRCRGPAGPRRARWRGRSWRRSSRRARSFRTGLRRARSARRAGSARRAPPRSRRERRPHRAQRHLEAAREGRGLGRADEDDEPRGRRQAQLERRAPARDERADTLGPAPRLRPPPPSSASSRSAAARRRAWSWRSIPASAASSG